MINKKVLMDYNRIKTFKVVEVIRMMSEAMKKGDVSVCVCEGHLCYNWEEPIAIDIMILHICRI